MVIDAPMSQAPVRWASARPESRVRKYGAAILTALAYLGLFPAGQTILFPFIAFMGVGNIDRVLRGEEPLPFLAGAYLGLAGIVFILMVNKVVRGLRRDVLYLDFIGVTVGVLSALILGVACLFPLHLIKLMVP